MNILNFFFFFFFLYYIMLYYYIKINYREPNEFPNLYTLNNIEKYTI